METRLVRISACFKGKNFCDSVSGIVKTVDIRNLRSVAKIFKGTIQEEPEYFSYSYNERPTVYIYKKNGLIYAEQNNVETQKQAWHLIRGLAHFGYIDNFQRRQQRNKGYIKGWID